MVNSEEFIKRLKNILSFHNLSASTFADKISVQRSTISHLLSGRNKPSLDFILKIIDHFPEVNLYWLLKGEGSFPMKEKILNSTSPSTKNKETNKTFPEPPESKEIEKIIVFYNDGSFKLYKDH